LIEREEGQTPEVAPEAEAPDAVTPDAVTPDAVAPEAETANGDTANGDTANGERTTGETADGDTADAEAAAPPEPEAEPVRTLAELAADARYSATGKRKTAVARVIIRPGTGQFELNGRSLEVYFPRRVHQAVVRQPLEIVGFADRVDVRARIHGGGISGQADAVRHGIAKALIEADPALRGELKRRQLLTRDPREKERRKAGLKKARKRPQFSKR
jgi:small subunit ribosomal protein S9